MAWRKKYTQEAREATHKRRNHSKNMTHAAPGHGEWLDLPLHNAIQPYNSKLKYSYQSQINTKAYARSPTKIRDNDKESKDTRQYKETQGNYESIGRV